MARIGQVSARPQTAADAGFLEELVMAVREQEHGYRELLPDERNKLLKEQNRLQLDHYARAYPSAYRTIIEVEGRPVGRLYVHHTPEEIHIIELSLMPDYQGHGIGKKFIESILAESLRSQSPVTLSVVKNNPARFFYEKLGFRQQAGPSQTHDSMVWEPPR